MRQQRQAAMSEIAVPLLASLRWSGGKRNVTIVVLARIARALKTTPDRLLVPKSKAKGYVVGRPDERQYHQLVWAVQ